MWQLVQGVWVRKFSEAQGEDAALLHSGSVFCIKPFEHNQPQSTCSHKESDRLAAQSCWSSGNKYDFDQIFRALHYLVNFSPHALIFPTD